MGAGSKIARVGWVLGTVGLLLGHGALLHADEMLEQTSQLESDIDEVVVSATKTPREVRDVPAAASVISQDEIDHRAPQSVGDLLREEVGVEITGGPRQMQAQKINIRGLSDERVLVRIDDARYNAAPAHRGSLFFDVEDLERVEILRGPASALYGSDAIGGVVSLRTKDPRHLLKDGDRMGVSMKSTFQSANREFRESVRTFGRPVDAFEYLVGYTRWDSRDIKVPHGERIANSASEGNGFLTKLIAHPTQHSDLAFNFQSFKDNAKVPSNAETNRSTEAPLVARDTERTLFNLAGDSVSTQGGLVPSLHGNIYWHLTQLFEDRYLLPGTTTKREDTRDFDTFGFEARGTNEWTFSPAVNRLTYGLEFYRDRSVSRRKTSTTITGIGGEPDARFNAAGLFVQDELELFDRLLIVPGIRWDTFRSTTAGQDRQTDSRGSPKIGATFKLTDDVSLYSHFAWGFRAPRLDELFATGQHFPGNSFVVNPSLRPEKSRNIEVGARGKLGRVAWDSSYFLLRAHDFIETVVTATTTTSRNVTRAQIWGLENSLEFDLGFTEPMKGLAAFATYDYLIGKNRDTGAPIDSVPPDTFTLGLRYAEPHERFWASFSGRIVDEQGRVSTPASATAGYAVWDVKGGIPIPGIKGANLTLGVENLFNKRYREHLASLPEAGTNFIVGLSETITW